ncbi:putative lipase esterase [Lyophyllum shimeji]|uniref:Lipase esterase n=1 Tax=Lyophyllum shimeji TaxID=47721 RepID=A0A9P3UM94_LYOSH|nr:putative lipase esterase [Lyophyllum shimeji]
MTDRIAHQPLHPSIIPRLDPEYLAFHTSTLQYIVPPHTLPWDPAIRNAPAVPGGSAPLEVARTQDFDLTHTKVRAFTPKGETPEGGWPVFIFFHGGGWTLGNIASETSFATNMAVRANCVVVSVDYRLAPEHPYPAAVDDAIESLDWVVQHGSQLLNTNASRIAVGGSSSGGNLAAILALKAAQRSPPIPLVFQLLIVPVTDNTASATSLWSENQHTPWLSPARMLWFRQNYLPNEADRTKWDASPLFAPAELLARAPGAWIGVAGLDILREEGVRYGERLRAEGVRVEVRVYEGAPHPVMAMDGTCAGGFLLSGWTLTFSGVTVMCVRCAVGALKVGKQLVSDAAAALKKALWEE